MPRPEFVHFLKMVILFNKIATIYTSSLFNLRFRLMGIYAFFFFFMAEKWKVSCLLWRIHDNTSIWMTQGRIQLRIWCLSCLPLKGILFS